MKKLIGFLIILCSVALIGIVILQIWDVSIVSTGDLLRSGATLVLLGVLTVVLLIVYGLFFRNSKKGYTGHQDEGRAHPKL